MFLAKSGNMICECGNNEFSVHVMIKAAVPVMAFRCTACSFIVKYEDTKFTDMKEEVAR